MNANEEIFVFYRKEIELVQYAFSLHKFKEMHRVSNLEEY